MKLISLAILLITIPTIAHAQVLGDPVDVSQDFQRMENVYFIGSRVTSFDTNTGQGLSLDSSQNISSSSGPLQTLFSRLLLRRMTLSQTSRGVDEENDWTSTFNHHDSWPGGRPSRF